MATLVNSVALSNSLASNCPPCYQPQLVQVALGARGFWYYQLSVAAQPALLQTEVLSRLVCHPEEVLLGLLLQL